MAVETSDGIVSPESTDEYALVADLSALAESAQVVINKRANAYIGTQADRIAATNDVAEGVLWKDTTGSGGLWSKQGSGWALIWPTPASRQLVVGSGSEELGEPFITLRQLTPEHYYANTIETGSSSLADSKSFMFFHQVDGSVESYWALTPTGYIQFGVPGNPAKTIFPQTTGTLNIAAGSYTANEVETRTINFPSGFFNAPPKLVLSAGTNYPHGTFLSYDNSSISESSATIRFYRTGSITGGNTAFSITWTAIQGGF